MTEFQKLLGKALHAWGAEYNGRLTLWGPTGGRLTFPGGACLEISVGEEVEACFKEEGETVTVARVPADPESMTDFTNRVGLYLQGARGEFSGVS